MANGIGYGSLGAGAGGMIAGLVNLFTSGDAGEDELREAIQLFRRIRDPNFDFRQLTPPQLQFIAQVDPAFYEARVPPEAKTIAESGLRGDQLRALGGLQRIGEEGMPLVDRLAAQAATESVARQMSGNRQAMMQQLAARGRLGPGAAVQAQAQADQAMGQYYGQVGRGLAQDAAQRRLQGLVGAGSLATAGRTQDIERRRRNAEMINNMNRYISALQTDQARYQADVLNQQRMQEASQRQRIADANRMMQYQTNLQNLERFNQLQNQLFGARMGRASAMAGGYGDLANLQVAQETARARNIQNLGSGAGQTLGGLAGSFMGKPTRRRPDVYKTDPYLFG